MTLEDFFKRIESQYNNQLPFVAYRKPNNTLVNGLLQETTDLHFTADFTEKGFVFSPFDDTEETVLMPLDNSESIHVDSVVLEIHTEPVERKEGIHSFHTTKDLKEKQQHINLIKKRC